MSKTEVGRIRAYLKAGSHVRDQLVIEPDLNSKFEVHRCKLWLSSQNVRENAHDAIRYD